jgi:hypothetical protein
MMETDVVKLIFMDTKTETLTVAPPRLIPSIIMGFNLVTNHIQLIIVPIILDVLLWFAPHIRVKTLMDPLVAQTLSDLKQLSSSDMADLIQATKDSWQIILGQFNMISLIRTYPIGVPSLLASSGPIQTPLGSPIYFEIPSIGLAVLLFLIFSLIGLILGSVYFYQLARLGSNEKSPFSLRQVSWQSLQAIWLTVLLIALMAILAVPSFLVVTIVSILNPTLASIAIVVLSLILIWVLMPMVFSPHGIFSFNLSAMKSIRTSVRLVRFFLPSTGLFLLVLLLFWQGLDILWRAAPETSWMTMVGIFGHAFISTCLLSASFVYYRGGMRWMQAALLKISNPAVRA